MHAAKSTRENMKPNRMKEIDLLWNVDVDVDVCVYVFCCKTM